MGTTPSATVQRYAAATARYLSWLSIAVATSIGIWFAAEHRGYVFRPWHELWPGAVLTICGCLCVAFWFLSLTVDRAQRAQVLRQARFIFVNGWSALTGGVGVASALAGCYWMMAQTSGAGARFDGIMSIYLSVVVLALGVTAFYTRYAPITDVRLLIKEVEHDLLTSDNSVEVWVVFPALCFGTYRYTRENLPHEARPDFLFMRALETVATRVLRGTGRVYMLTYPERLWTPFFTAYADQLGDTGEMKRKCVEKCCSTSSKTVWTVLGAAEGEGDAKKRIMHRVAEPSEMPQGVILVGTTVYSLASYGLPRYVQNDQFRPLGTLAEGGHGEYVELIAFRKEDPELAKSVRRHLVDVWNTLEPDHGASSRNHDRQQDSLKSS